MKDVNQDINVNVLYAAQNQSASAQYTTDYVDDKGLKQVDLRSTLFDLTIAFEHVIAAATHGNGDPNAYFEYHQAMNVLAKTQ